MASSAHPEAAGIYRGYDKTGLEAQYNLRASHPDREPVYASYDERSLDFRKTALGEYDVPYGPAERQRLDIFPSADKAARVLVFFHGGYWRTLDKSVFSFMAEPFVAAGWSVVLVNYTLAPDASIDEIVDQAAQSLVAVRDRFPKSRGIVLSGHSAGGQLALMTLLNDGEGAAASGSRNGSEVLSPIVAGLTISGVFDLEPIRHTTINDLVRLDADSAARNSPIGRIAPSSVPLFVAAGAKETNEFRGQSRRFATSWRAFGNRAELYLVDGANHFTILGALADTGGAFQQTVWRFLDTV